MTYWFTRPLGHRRAHQGIRKNSRGNHRLGDRYYQRRSFRSKCSQIIVHNYSPGLKGLVKDLDLLMNSIERLPSSANIASTHLAQLPARVMFS
jgi:hypothetical protein